MLVGRTIAIDDEVVLNEFFPRWRVVNWVVCPNELSLMKLIRRAKLRPIAIEVSRIAVPYYLCELQNNDVPAFIVGSEDNGIPDSLLKCVSPHIYIPMAGKATCLSAGMALAIVATHFAYVANSAVTLN